MIYLTIFFCKINYAWKIGDYVRSASYKESKEIYQIIGEKGDDWVMYAHGYLGGGYNYGYIPKCVELIKRDDGTFGWEKLLSSNIIGRPSNKQFEMFKNI